MEKYMFTKFHNVSFIASTVTGLELEMNTIHILTTGQSYEVRFKTNEEAQAGLSELTDILNAASGQGSTNSAQEAQGASKVNDLKDILNSGLNRLQGILESAKSTATDKVQEAVMAQVLGTAGKTVSDLMDYKEALVTRATDLLSTLEKALEPEEKPMATRNEPKSEPTKKTECFKDEVATATSILDVDSIFTSSAKDLDVSAVITPKKMSADHFKSIFGTPEEPLIGDLSERQLREFIGEFVDGALANERVQHLFQNIKDNFGADEAEGAIDGYKNLILTICLQNTEMTLSEVISRYFN